MYGSVGIHTSTDISFQCSQTRALEKKETIPER